LLIAFAAAACSGDAEESEGPSRGAVDAGGLTISPGLLAEDILLPDREIPSRGVRPDPDHEPPPDRIILPTAVAPEPCPAGGDLLGCPCEDGDDCESGYCVSTELGSICVDVCAGSCEAGFACVAMQAAGPDLTYLCVPRFAKLCQPCLGNADCRSEGDAGEGYCLDYGAEGRFCGSACAEDTECPDGYECRGGLTGDRGAGGQCVLAEGSCGCNTTGALLQMSTHCQPPEGESVCPGTRVCGEDGLSECVARQPSAEVCDRTDNDCNGVVDDVEGEPCAAAIPAGSCAELDCDDFNPCTADRCDEELGGCTHEHLPDGLACDADGDPCTAGDSCELGQCMPGSEDPCGGVDGGECGGSVCSALSVDEHFCSSDPAPFGAPCDDGLYCTVDDVCDGNGLCVAGRPRDCAAGADVGCVESRCDERSRSCEAFPRDDGALCDDAEACTSLDLCRNGRCLGSEDRCVEEPIGNQMTGDRLSMASLGFGRYVTMASTTNRLSRNHWLRITAEDGSREGAEKNLSTATLGIEGFRSRMAVGPAGDFLSAYRKNTSSLRLTLLGYDGEELLASDFDVPHVSSNHSSGSALPVAFSDGSFGVVAAISGTNRIRYARASSALEAGDWMDLVEIANNKVEVVDVAELHDGSGFWLLYVGRDTNDLVRAVKLDQLGNVLSEHHTLSRNPASVSRMEPVKVSGAARADGGVVVAWASRSLSSGVADTVQVRVVGESGPLTDIVDVPAEARGDQQGASVAVFSDGGFVVAWHAWGVDAAGSAVMARLFDGQAQPKRTIQVNTTDYGDEHGPAVLTLPDDDFVVAFFDDEDEVWTRRFQVDGSDEIGRPERRAHPPAKVDTLRPDGAAAGNGNVALVFEEPDTANERTDVVARFFGPLGSPMGGELPVNTGHAVMEPLPSVAAAGNRFRVAYVGSVESDGRRRIYLHSFDAVGRSLGPSRALTPSDAYRCGLPDIALRPGGDGALIFVRENSNGDRRLHGVALDTEGRAKSEPAALVDWNLTGPSSPRVAALPEPAGPERYVFVWHQASSAGLGPGLVVRALDVKGKPLDQERLISDIATNHQTKPAVAARADGTALTCWLRLTRSTLATIYCQAFDPATLDKAGEIVKVAEGVESAGGHRVLGLGCATSGDCAIAWAKAGPDNDGLGIETLSIRPDGSPRGLGRVVNRSWPGQQSLPFVVPNGPSRVWIGWQTRPAKDALEEVRFRIL